MTQGHTDEQLQILAVRLQLKTCVHQAFYETALKAFNETYNKHCADDDDDDDDNMSTTQNPRSEYREQLAKLATKAFLEQGGYLVWPSYVKMREHLTVTSPFGDNRREFRRLRRVYRRERKRWQDGHRGKRPIPPKIKKGLVYSGGSNEIEPQTNAYFVRLFEMMVTQRKS